jgi:excisionase family DNA binding protein
VEKLLTIGQVAERLDRHYTTVYRWVKSGDLPFVLKIGNRHFFSEAVVTDLAPELLKSNAGRKRKAA